jgi:hypothetical protein
VEGIVGFLNKREPVRIEELIAHVAMYYRYSIVKPKAKAKAGLVNSHMQRAVFMFGFASQYCFVELFLLLKLSTDLGLIFSIKVCMAVG